MECINNLLDEDYRITVLHISEKLCKKQKQDWEVTLKK